MVKLTQQERRELRRRAKIELARRDFWHYCRLRFPDVYTDKPNKEYLRNLCVILNNLYRGLPLDATGKIYKKVMLNLPPRHYKTFTLTMWCEWILGQDQEERIINGSYNEREASDFGKYVRDAIDEKKNTPEQLLFADVFPGVRLKHGYKSYQKWALDGQHFSFMSTSPGGSLTGKGGTIKILDDLVKGFEESVNEIHLDKLYAWYVGTYASRTEVKDSGEGIEVVCATRWSKKDPCGRILADEPDDWFVYNLDVYDEETGEMLCDDVLSLNAYKRLENLAKKNKNPVLWATFLANYHQKIVDAGGLLYPSLNTYDKLPEDGQGNSLFEKVKAYVDTADEGKDFLACGIYGIFQRKAYMLDVYYTKESMETTEPEAVRRFIKHKVNLVEVESNAGGRGFARKLRDIIAADPIADGIIVHWFHQSKNKNSRIFSQSNNVQESIYFPVDWGVRWPAFYEHVTTYQKEGKHEHDDAEDMLTGIVEKMGNVAMWG